MTLVGGGRLALGVNLPILSTVPLLVSDLFTSNRGSSNLMDFSGLLSTMGFLLTSPLLVLNTLELSYEVLYRDSAAALVDRVGVSIGLSF